MFLWAKMKNEKEQFVVQWTVVEEVYTPSSGVQFSSVQSLSHVQLFVIPWTAARQASLSTTNSGSLSKFTSIELVMPCSFPGSTMNNSASSHHSFELSVKTVLYLDLFYASFSKMCPKVQLLLHFMPFWLLKGCIGTLYFWIAGGTWNWLGEFDITRLLNKQ